MTGRVEGAAGPVAGPARAAELADRLAALRERVAAACRSAGRPPAEVTVIAVSKTWPADDVAVLAALGVVDFGENRAAQGAGKAAALAGTAGLRWHFVGQLQRNKARTVAAYASVVHSVDRVALVGALDEAAARVGRRLGVCVQADLSGQPGRGGAPPALVPSVAAAVDAAGWLDLAGIMLVAPLGVDSTAAYAGLPDLARAVRSVRPQARMVSAGMSADLEAAVAAGATHVRVGTALFGGRPPPVG